MGGLGPRGWESKTERVCQAAGENRCHSQGNTEGVTSGLPAVRQELAGAQESCFCLPAACFHQAPEGVAVNSRSRSSTVWAKEPASLLLVDLKGCQEQRGRHPGGFPALQPGKMATDATLRSTTAPKGHVSHPHKGGIQRQGSLSLQLCRVPVRDSS